MRIVRVVFAPELPKTRSRKIMRRLLRDVALVEEIRDRAATEPSEESRSASGSA